MLFSNLSLPNDIIRFHIIPFLTIIERHGIDSKTEMIMNKQLKYPRDHRLGTAKRLFSYFNTIRINNYPDVRSPHQDKFVIDSGLFCSVISLHRCNYHSFCYFYFENQIQFRGNDSHKIKIINFIQDNHHKNMMTIICKNDRFWSLSVSNKCDIGYSLSNVHLGPKQLFIKLYLFHQCLKIHLKDSIECEKQNV